MRLVLPGSEVVHAFGGPTGLAGTARVRVVSDGATVTAATTSGIVEYPAGSGVYQVTITAPDAVGQYIAAVDDGSLTPDHITLFEFEVAYTTPTVVTSNLYVTRTELATTLELTGSTFADADIDIALSAACRAIDAYCGRRFYADADAAQVRYYSPTTGDLLYIDDLVTLTSVKTDPGNDNTYEDTWTVDTDFVLEPRNALANGWPYSSIRRLVGANFWFPHRWADSVEVTGKFGWAATPPQIVEATTIIATRFLRRAREAPFGVVTFGSDPAAAARLARVDPDVRFLLDPFRKWRPFV